MYNKKEKSMLRILFLLILNLALSIPLAIILKNLCLPLIAFNLLVIFILSIPIFGMFKPLEKPVKTWSDFIKAIK